MNFKISLSILITLSALVVAFRTPPREAQLNRELDAYIEEVRDKYGIPGVAFAVIKDGRVIHQNNYGFANIEHEVSVSEQSIFQLYSLTKPIVTVGIFRLIEQGKLSLNDAVSKHVKDLPKEWKKIKVQHLLSHSSGLPDMFGSNPNEFRDQNEFEAKQRVFNQPLEFKAGKRFSYNQTNFWLVKVLIEKLSGQSLSDFILDHQFPDSKPENVFFSHDARDIIPHRATSYFPFAKGKLMIDLPYTNGDYFFAANGLHLRLKDFIEWDRRFRANELISAESKEQMWSFFPYSESDKKFAYGWGIYHYEGKSDFGFSGSLCTMYRTFPAQNLSVLLLSNGLSSMYNMELMLNGAVGIVNR